MKLEPPTGEFTHQRPTATVPVARYDATRHFAAENLGKTDTVLALPGDKWASLTFGLDHRGVTASHDLRGGVATAGGLNG